MKNNLDLALELEAVNLSCIEISNELAAICAKTMEYDVVFG